MAKSKMFERSRKYLMGKWAIIFRMTSSVKIIVNTYKQKKNNDFRADSAFKKSIPKNLGKF